MVHLPQEDVQRPSRSTIPALLISRAKALHLSNPPPVGHQLRKDNLVWAQHQVLVLVPLKDSHPREALRLVKVPHPTQLFQVATLHHHKGMVLDQERDHPRQDSALACRVLRVVSLRRDCSLVAGPLRNSSLRRCHPLVSPCLKLPHRGGSERCSAIVL